MTPRLPLRAARRPFRELPKHVPDARFGLCGAGLKHVDRVLEALAQRGELAPHILQRCDRHRVSGRSAQIEVRVQVLRAAAILVFVTDPRCNDADRAGRV